jgi:hypothetical protein
MRSFGLFIVILGFILLLTGISGGPAKFVLQYIQMMGVGILFMLVGSGIVWIVEHNKQ